jgi:hypothetical protein
MLKHQMDQIEDELLVAMRRSGSAGHPVNKGTPREAFVSGFLSDHLSSMLDVGTGEVIDASSRPEEKRPQIDLVVFRRSYPKLRFGGGIDAFMAESVVATIEVKSTLDKEGLRQAVGAGAAVKRLRRDPASSWIIGPGYKQPGVLSFLVAYDGPARMSTVAGWLPEIHEELGLDYPVLGPKLADRMKVVAPGIDGVFVLGKGCVTFDCLPTTFMSDDHRAAHPNTRWIATSLDRGSLLCLFITLTTAGSGLVFHGLNPLPYLERVRIEARQVELFD